MLAPQTPLTHHGNHGEQHHEQCENRRLASVEARRVGGVDAPGEGVEPHHGDEAKVTDGVEKDE